MIFFKKRKSTNLCSYLSYKIDADKKFIKERLDVMEADAILNQNHSKNALRSTHGKNLS